MVRSVLSILTLLLLFAPGALLARDDPGLRERLLGPHVLGEPPGRVVVARADDPAADEEPAPGEEGEPAPAASERRSQGKAAPAGDEGTQDKRSRYALGLQGRFIFVPFGFLDLFLEAGRGLYSGSLGLEFIYRLESLDVVSSLNFGFSSPPDGNFVGNDKPASDIDYVQFRDLNLLALDVTFLWNFEIKPWLSFVVGPGIGIGIVLGEIWRMDGVGCTYGNVDDLSQCNPAPPNEKQQFAADPEAWLEKQRQLCASGQRAQNNCEWKEDDVWPVVPVVHLLLGLDFKVTEKIHVRVDGGFHNAFFFGTAGHYYF